MRQQDRSGPVAQVWSGATYQAQQDTDKPYPEGGVEALLGVEGNCGGVAKTTNAQCCLQLQLLPACHPEVGERTVLEGVGHLSEQELGQGMSCQNLGLRCDTDKLSSQGMAGHAAGHSKYSP